MSIEELSALQVEYKENKARAYATLRSIEVSFTGGTKVDNLHRSLAELSETSAQLFAGQFSQRALEEQSNLSVQEILRLTEKMEHMIGQLLTTSTAHILSTSRQFGARGELSDDLLDQFLSFAGETETLHTLNSHVVGITNLTKSNFGNGAGPGPDFANKLRFLIRSVTQTLSLLSETEARKQFARLVADLNRAVTADDGYLALNNRIAKSRLEHDRLKLVMISIVSQVDRDVEQIVAAAAILFRSDIQVTNQLTRNIVWIGVVTSFLLAVGLAVANRKLIQEQISNRFTTLTQDVLAISNGNYEHEVRVTGEDELGDIAHALDIFKKQAAELERSNLELERFAYVAAHDLKSPLDAIQDLAKWTLEDAGDELADLLKYAQANSVSDGVATLDIGVEIDKIADLLDPTNRFDIQLVGDLCEVTCHYIPFRQILLNLITNAIKHHDRNEGKIAISCAGVNGMLRVAVTDDGVGIEPKFQRKIFELFKTLQSRDRVEGSGLGLALVTKLVERLEGSVSVQSDAPNTRGTTFTFELPDMGTDIHIKRAA
ncbi:Phytochrome-like protein cph1 [Nymphon striatum]|nr:Phytochrome-like protein cph1 [Nymphon striatum]